MLETTLHRKPVLCHLAGEVIRSLKEQLAEEELRAKKATEDQHFSCEGGLLKSYVIITVIY